MNSVTNDNWAFYHLLLQWEVFAYHLIMHYATREDFQIRRKNHITMKYISNLLDDSASSATAGLTR